ncbi:uncharacterized protein bcorl1 [Stigmatopora nigra]
MQVDSSLMNVGDGGTVSRDIGAPNKSSASMVGNPPQTLPLEFRGDVTLARQNETAPTADCKTARACPDAGNYKRGPEASPPWQLDDDATSDVVADKRAGEAAKPQADGAVPRREDSAQPTRGKKSPSAPAGFQCSLFKPARPVAFLPSADFSSSPLCKVTLPPALEQIAALRDGAATGASPFPKDMEAQSSGAAGTPLVRTYHYPFPVNRMAASEKKSGKIKANHSSGKNAKSSGERKSPTAALPLLKSTAPTRYTLSPTAAICCGSALATIASQSRLLNHVEKSLGLDKIAIDALKTEEQRAARSAEQRDVPLDLSAKSKRPKCAGEPPPAAAESKKMDFSDSKRTHSAAYGAAEQYPFLPNTQRNGSHQKIRSPIQKGSELKPAWSKGAPQEPVKNIPGTYVGVASPILASTLRGKDGKGTFADEFQSFAKQEFISIVDQGDQGNQGNQVNQGKRPPSLKPVKSPIPKNSPPKGALMSALSGTPNANAKAGKVAGAHPAWPKSNYPGLQASSALRKIAPAPPMAKESAESPKLASPPAPSEHSWDKASPLAKRREVETVASRKDNGLTLLKDVPSKRASRYQVPAFHSTENWTGVSIQEGLNSSGKRTEKSKSDETLDEIPEAKSYRGEEKHGFSKIFGQSHSLRSNASTNGNRLESKLAQVLEGEIPKKDRRESRGHRDENLGGLVASILSGRSPDRGEEKKSSLTKEEWPTKKVKKVSPKKASKEKSSAKKTKDKESTPTKVSSPKKKKHKTSELEQQLSSPSTEHAGKDVEAHHKTDGGGPEREESRAFKSAAKESSFPRLRRGRRRTDDARSDLWGFATPSPPPPPPPPAASPPRTPPRRPRGRPRSKRWSERDVRDKGEAEDAPALKRRRHCRNPKYQTGEYVTDKDKLDEGDHLDESDSGIAADSQTAQCPSPAASSPGTPPRRPSSFTRSGSARYQAGGASPESHDKPSGKRKFKSKHLCDNDELKTKSKRGNSGKRGTPAAPSEDVGAENGGGGGPPPPSKSPPPSGKKSSAALRNGSPESPPKRPIPPEVRRLIVNKNAGETLLQRAARLGYQEVVQYCLEKDTGEVNRRDNAGYTALHEASSRGWTQIVQMLLKHGADVNCSAQDGTRPLHDAVASDNLPIVWLLLNHGADPTLATYSGHTPVKLAQSATMKTFLTEYFTDLEGRNELDPTLHWDFYSSSLFETTGEEPCWDFLLSEQSQELAEGGDSNKDGLVFEFSSEPLLPCYHVQVSVTQGFCNWFLLSDVLGRLKMSARLFRARHPHLELASLSQAELGRQVLLSQVGSSLDSLGEDQEEGEEGMVDLVRCVPEVQRLLGSSIHILRDEDEEEDDDEKAARDR